MCCIGTYCLDPNLTRRIKLKELLKIVSRGGKSAYDVFVEVLLQSETQTSLGELLKKDSTMMDDHYGKPIC